MALEKQVWVADIQENPIPDNSFVFASEDKSEHVDNNIINLAEAGIDPAVHENFFESNPDAELPIASIEDIPHEVTLKIYSTEVTRHRNLEEVELAYNKRQSIINRHKNSIAKGLGKRAAYAWTPSVDSAVNKFTNLGDTDSVIDAIVDLRAFYMANDINEELNLCLTPAHWARIKKEDKKLYKEMMKDKEYIDFTLFTYSQNPIFDATGIKKPFGSIAEPTDKRASFSWVKTEVFRSFGDTELYLETSAKAQADLLSFGQRALVGNIRANNPKYLGGFI